MLQGGPGGWQAPPGSLPAFRHTLTLSGVTPPFNRYNFLLV